jgi:hypothetical protein
MGIGKYMGGLIDKTRKKVQDTIGNIGPMKRLSEGLEGKPITPIKPLPSELPRPKGLTPANKRKKIKPKK